jgi:hypothetical protein
MLALTMLVSLSPLPAVTADLTFTNHDINRESFTHAQEFYGCHLPDDIASEYSSQLVMIANGFSSNPYDDIADSQFTFG